MRMIDGVRYYPGSPVRRGKPRPWPPKDRHRRAVLKQHKRALVQRLLEVIG